MQHPKDLSTKERIIQAIARVLGAVKWPLVFLLIALAAFVLIYLVVGEVRSNRIEKSTVIAERIEDDFESWLALEEDEDRETAGVDLLERIDGLIESYPRYYAAQRALYIRGRIYFQTATWEGAKDSFVEIADRFPKSYLAPIALVNAATAMEEAEKFDDAIKLLVRVTEEFLSPEVPAVLFSLGRLHETTLDPDGALRYYNRLLDEHPSSGWTNLAQTRIIVINIDRS